MGALNVSYRILYACLVARVAMVNCSTTMAYTPQPSYNGSADTTHENIDDQLAMLKSRLETLSTVLQETRQYFTAQLQQTEQELRQLHGCPCRGAGEWCSPKTCNSGNGGGQDLLGLELSIKMLTSKVSTLGETLTEVGDDIQRLPSLYGKLKNKLNQQQEDLDRLTEGQNEARQASADLSMKVDGMRTAVAGQQDDLDKLGQGQTTLQDGLHNLVDRVDMLKDLVTNFTAAHPTNCQEATKDMTSGVYRIWITPSFSRDVYCEGAWTVIQRRLNGQVDFYQNWQGYKLGFGNAENEYWLGLEAIHQMTSVGRWQLRVDLGDWDCSTAYALYSGFKVSPESDYYRLSYDSYDAGTAGDSFASTHRGRQFSTKDQDHDTWKNNCAVSYLGGWWYADCHISNLNGQYKSSSTSDNTGIIWKAWKGYNYSLKSSVMKIRPV